MKKWSMMAATLLVPSGVTIGFLNAAAPSVSANTSGQVQVSMFAVQPADVQNLDTNWFTKYVEEKFNMKITWITPPSTDAKTKQALLFQSGQYPDVIWDGSLSPSDIMNYSQEGILIPLNHLIKQYAPNLQKAIQTIPALKEAITTPSGNIYGLPYYNLCWHCNWADKYYINSHLLKQFGLKMPTTTAQFQHVLEAFKQHGVKYPLTGSPTGWHSNPVPFLMNSFIYDDGIDYFYINKSGKLAFAPAQPQWRQGLSYIHGLVANGLLQSTALTQSYDSFLQEVNTGKVGVVSDPGPNGFLTNYGSPQSHYQWWTTDVPPLKGPNGVRYSAFYGTPPSNAVFGITNHASPAAQTAIMKLVNFLYTPLGMQMMDFGPEGKFWTYAKKGQVGLYGNPAHYNSNWNAIVGAGAQQNLGWNQIGPGDQGKQWWSYQAVPGPYTPTGSQSLLQLTTMRDYAGLQPKKVYPGFIWLPPAVEQQYAMLQTNINNYVTQWQDEFIAGGKSVSKDWGAYIQGLNNLGLSQYLQITSKYMGKPFDTSSFKSDPKDTQILEHLK